MDIHVLKTLIEYNPMVILIYILFFALVTYYFIRTTQAYYSPLNKIPEPEGYGILRHLPYFVNNKDSDTTIDDWCEKFKEKGIFRIDPFISKGSSLVFPLKLEYVKTILSKPDYFPRRNDKLKSLLTLVGNALLSSDGEDHRFQKMFFRKSFTVTQIKCFIPVFSKHAKILTEIWEDLVKSKENGENIIVKDYFNSMTLDAVGEISFGYSFNSQRSKLSPLIEAVVLILEGVLDFKYRSLLDIFPFLWYMPFGPAKTLADAVKKANNSLDEVIMKRLKLMKEGNLTEIQKNDLLAMMLNDRDEYFTDQLVKDFAFTFLLAGQETTASGLPGILMYLSKNPEMQECMRKEIQEHIDGSDNMNIEDLNKLTYTDAFIKESLRLFSALPRMGRISKVDYKFGDYLVPKGTAILLPISFINRNEFEKGNDFLPDRWLNDSELKKGSLLTFGYGPLACIGKHFALLETKVTLVHLMKKFRFSMDPGCDKFNRITVITLKVYPDLKIRVHPL